MLALVQAAVIPEDDYDDWSLSCPYGWTMYRTRCLLYVPRNMTWTQAEEHCKAMEGTLASVYDAGHAKEIREQMQSFGESHGKVWVGGHNTPENPSWSWSDFLGVHQFTQFCGGQSAKNEHHCLQLTFAETGSGCLDYMHCDAELPSVCSIVLM
ncbi:type-2 ice-structuring protein-like [Stegastes partitus]|nr:PREDICTED: type-2 ice-structuring protein-like [Stegastes partitus]